MPKFLFVAGAWLGGWCWRDVAPHLQAGGHAAIFATLTGLGERAHLLSRQIGLQTHVADIVGLLHYRDLKGVTLVGHSYGGTVITAVAEQVPERIRGLIYLDASVPRDGESNNDVIVPAIRPLPEAHRPGPCGGVVLPRSQGWTLSDADGTRGRRRRFERAAGMALPLSRKPSQCLNMPTNDRSASMARSSS
jgi:pimeloyl-ACP methyl ester carboxylesterase